MFRSNGQNGLDNIRKMTDDNGFIMIVGCGRDYIWRNSLANLNYIELAEVVGFPSEVSVILIPNNQNLSFEKVKQQIDALPIPLKKSIEKATSRKIGESIVHRLETTAFCKLNYKVSDENKELINALNMYIIIRGYHNDYKTSFNFLGFKFNFGYSRDEKINAANALINVLLGNQPIGSLTIHRKILSDGMLGRIVDNHLNGRSIQSLVHPTPQKNDLENRPNSLRVPHVSSERGGQASANVYEEKLRRIKLMDRYTEQPRSEEQDKVETERLERLGIDTFISYSDLQELAENRVEFFLPPTSQDEGCLSCGNGHLYRGSIKDIYHQLQSELKKDPHNEKILVGLERVNKELLAFPDKFSLSNKESSNGDQPVLSSQSDYKF